MTKSATYDKNSTEKAAQALGDLLYQSKFKVTTAESCTAGGIANVITSVPGSSSWFEYGFVTYSNRAKENLLNVSSLEIIEHGAVSEVVVKSMLRGALARSGAQVGVAVSGIAGPGGGVKNKPVGTICFAWGSSEDLRYRTEHFLGDREAIRKESVLYAMQSLIEFLRN